MIMRGLGPLLALAAVCAPACAGEVKFAKKPRARKSRGKVTVTFAVSKGTDVEVAVLNAKGEVVRHLAAGVLGAKKAPPKPLAAGLSQTIAWDMKDDFGKPAEGGPFKVRVRAGTGVKFEKFIGSDPYNFGRITAAGLDEDGNIYVQSFFGQLNQRQMHLRAFDKEGSYLRELLPFPADLPEDAMGSVARWDEKRKTFQPRQRSNLNPDFYGCKGKKPLEMVSVSKKTGIFLKGRRSYVLTLKGAIDGYRAPAGAPPLRAAGLAGLKTRLTPKGRLPLDWGRITVDTQRDEVYVNNGCSQVWRFDGETGKGAELKKNGRTFGATDLTVGYDGLLYMRTGRGVANGCDYSGPFARYTRDLEPASFKGGSHVISKYIYSRYGIGYAERGIGVRPDGGAYISFMYKWVHYCIAGFGPDGKPLAGKYLKGEVGGKGPKGSGGYPADLDSAIIGPIPQANGGIRVDLAGNIYVGMLLHPEELKIPEGQDKMVWSYMVGGVVRFTPEGGYVKGSAAMMRGKEAVGATAYYQGLAPLSSAGFTANKCCVCRGARFDLDRWGRLIIPNAVSNSVRYVDNSGNLIVEFGKYGNFDSQYVNPNTKAGKKGKPTVAAPAIPLGWPTGAGFGKKRFYVLDTYARRVVCVARTYAAAETCAVR